MNETVAKLSVANAQVLIDLGKPVFENILNNNKYTYTDVAQDASVQFQFWSLTPNGNDNTFAVNEVAFGGGVIKKGQKMYPRPTGV